jgi:hypothetical protein
MNQIDLEKQLLSTLKEERVTTLKELHRLDMLLEAHNVRLIKMLEKGEKQ